MMPHRGQNTKSRLLHYYLRKPGIILATGNQTIHSMKTRLTVLLLTLVIASCSAAKKGCPATNYQESKSNASKKSKAPKKTKTSSFNWYNG
jgi:hypothetical protein